MAKSSTKTAKEKIAEKSVKKSVKRSSTKSSMGSVKKSVKKSSARSSAKNVEETVKKDPEKKLDAEPLPRSKNVTETALSISSKSEPEVSSRTISGTASESRKSRTASSGLTAKQKDQVLAILSVGCSRKRAASFVGGTPALIQNAAARDKDFALALLQAESQAEITSMKSINAAARQERYWKAAAWILERKNPEEFRLRSPGTFNAEQLAFIIRNLSQIIAEEVRVPSDRKRILARLELFLKESAGELEQKNGTRKSVRSRKSSVKDLI